MGAQGRLCGQPSWAWNPAPTGGVPSESREGQGFAPPTGPSSASREPPAPLLPLRSGFRLPGGAETCLLLESSSGCPCPRPAPHTPTCRVCPCPPGPQCPEVLCGRTRSSFPAPPTVRGGAEGQCRRAQKQGTLDPSHPELLRGAPIWDPSLGGDGSSGGHMVSAFGPDGGTCHGEVTQDSSWGPSSSPPWFGNPQEWGSRPKSTLEGGRGGGNRVSPGTLGWAGGRLSGKTHPGPERGPARGRVLGARWATPSFAPA